MMEIFGAQTDLTIIAIIVTLIFQVIQRKLVDRKKMKANQEAMKEKQKKMQDLVKAQASQQEIDTLNKEIMQSMQEFMPGMMKSMVFSLVIAIPLFAFLGWNFAEAIISLPFPIPFWTGFDLLSPGSWFDFTLFSETNWLGWYALNGLVVALLFNVGEKVIQKFSGEES